MTNQPASPRRGTRPNGAQKCSHGWSADRRQAVKRNPWKGIPERPRPEGAAGLCMAGDAGVWQCRSLPSPLRGDHKHRTVSHGLRVRRRCRRPLHPWLHSLAPPGPFPPRRARASRRHRSQGSAPGLPRPLRASRPTRTAEGGCATCPGLAMPTACITPIRSQGSALGLPAGRQAWPVARESAERCRGRCYSLQPKRLQPTAQAPTACFPTTGSPIARRAWRPGPSSRGSPCATS